MLHPAPSYDTLCESFSWDIPKWYNMGVDVCDKWAEIDPDRIAIIDLTGDARIDVSFEVLKYLSDSLAQHLQEKGIGVGDRVGVFRTQSVWTAAAHIAIWKLGAISVPLFTLFRAEALLSRLNDAGAKAVCVDESSLQIITPFLDQLPAMEHVICPETTAFDQVSSGFEPYDTLADDPAILIYTSGTTGAPKGALLAHRTLLGHLPGVEMSHDFLPQKGDCLWTPADWAWIGGLLDVLMPGLHHGIPVVAARMKKFSATGCQEIIEKGGVRNVFFPPTALKMLKEEGVHIAGLRTVASGGEPLGRELVGWGKTALGLTINEFYGQTECNMVVSSCAKLFTSRNGCAGRIVPGHDVAVIDKNGLPTGCEGDIAVRRGSPVMMLEYWQNPTATRDKFRGNWLVMGDRGIMEDGFIRFVGREDDVITSAGYRIGPSAIENCLLGHEAVAAVAVVGKPDPKRTEIVKAYVKLSDGFTPGDALVKELQSHVKGALAAHEYPREVAFVDDLPMTVTGKIIRKELKARASAEAGAE
ncbi:MAG: AMP-binding protein [Amylibacter sp.]|nr:AMP-binding protein [Amylibacter sp.]